MKNLLYLKELRDKVFGTKIQAFCENYCIEIDNELYYLPQQQLLEEYAKDFLETNGYITSLEFKNLLREKYCVGITQKEVSEFLNEFCSNLEFKWETAPSGVKFKKYLADDSANIPFSTPSKSSNSPNLVELNFSMEELENLVEINVGKDGNDEIVYEPDDSILHTYCEELLLKYKFITARDLKLSLRGDGFYATQKGCEDWLKNHHSEFDREIEIVEFQFNQGTFLQYSLVENDDTDLKDALDEEDKKQYPVPTQDVIMDKILEVIQAGKYITARDLKKKLRWDGFYATQKSCEEWLNDLKDQMRLKVEDLHTHLRYVKEEKPIVKKYQELVGSIKRWLD